MQLRGLTARDMAIQDRCAGESHRVPASLAKIRQEKVYEIPSVLEIVADHLDFI